MADADSIPRLPRLRVHRRKGKSGQIWTSYYLDRRSLGLKDFPLGSCEEEAIKLWEKYQAEMPPILNPRRKLQRRAKGKRRTFNPGTWDDAPKWAKPMFLNAERRAEELQRPFTLAVHDLVRVIERAANRCEVSGLTFEERGPFRPSLDRIDCGRGYEPGNIRIVCHIANVAMNVWGEDALYRLAEAVLRKRLDTGCGTLATNNRESAQWKSPETRINTGARGRTRTDTHSREGDFESHPNS